MKKLNKFFAILVALAMMAMLSVTAFAATNANGATTGGTPGDPLEVKLTKNVNKATDITDTNVYSFHVDVDETTLPTGATFADYDVPLNAAGAGSIADIFNGKTFNKAGKYTFTVTENMPAETAEGATATATVPTVDNEGRVSTAVYQDGDVKTTVTTTYSPAVYQVVLAIAGNATDGYYIEQTAVNMTTADTATDTTGKVDPAADGFKFTNSINKTVENVGQPPKIEDEGKTLGINKTVQIASGKEGTVDTAKDFKFTLTMTAPANSSATAYTGQIVKADGTKVDDFSITLTDGTVTESFLLKDGYHLIFTKVDVGATYTLSEDEYLGYTVSYNDANSGTVKEANNVDAVTNTYDPDAGAITGVLISNLPYIALALVAIGGLVAYVAVRRKAEDEA